MRLIDAETLKKAIKEEICNFELPISASEIVPIIDNAPTVERPQGEWEEVGFTESEYYYKAKYKCPNCDKVYNYVDFCRIADCFPNFCPNCGADMMACKDSK